MTEEHQEDLGVLGAREVLEAPLVLVHHFPLGFPCLLLVLDHQWAQLYQLGPSDLLSPSSPVVPLALEYLLVQYLLESPLVRTPQECLGNLALRHHQAALLFPGLPASLAIPSRL